MQSQKITEFDVDTNGDVLLKNGSRIKNDILNYHLGRYFAHLNATHPNNQNFKIIYSDLSELLTKCQNSQFNFTDGAKVRLKLFDLLDSSGNIFPDVINIIESAITIKDNFFIIVDPRKKYFVNDKAETNAVDRFMRHHPSLKEAKKMSNPYPQSAFFSTSTSTSTSASTATSTSTSTSERIVSQQTSTTNSNEQAPSINMSAVRNETETETEIIYLPSTGKTKAEDLLFKKESGLLICVSSLRNHYGTVIEKLNKHYGCKFHKGDKGVPCISIESWKKAKINFAAKQHHHEFTLQISNKVKTVNFRFKLEYRYNQYTYYAASTKQMGNFKEKLKNLSLDFLSEYTEISLRADKYADIPELINLMKIKKPGGCRYQIINETGTSLPEFKKIMNTKCP